MSLVFLAPLVLAGLAAIAIPIYVHLTHRERKEPIVFPSLLFLEQIPYRTERRQRIRHWLLFLLRAAVVLLVIAAFARPLLEGGPVAPPTVAAARDVIVLLDRSASMAYGSRWPRATAAARGAIERIGPEDRLTLVAFDERPEALSQPTGDAATLTSILAVARPGARGTAYAPALRLAAELLDDDDRDREVVLITDFQQAGNREPEPVRLPPGTRLTRVNIAEEGGTNRAVTGVLVDRRRDGERERVAIAARVESFGGVNETDVPVSLELDGQVVQTVPVRVPGEGAAVARFAALQDPDRTLRARVSIAADALGDDDAYHFVLTPAPRLRVLLVSPAGASREDVYLTQALSVGHDPSFPVTVRPPTALRAEEINAANVVMLHGVPFPGGAAGRLLLGFVANGGGLLMALGPRETAVPAVLSDSVGRVTQEPVNRIDDLGGATGITDYQHPVFAPFRTADGGDLSTARVFRYRRIEPAGATVLARFDDGAVALLERRWGRGRLMFWASDFGNRWNDLPLRASFVPFVQHLVRYLAHHTPPPAARTAGSTVALADLLPAATDERLVLERPDGAREALDPGPATHVDLSRRGFYVLRPVDDRHAPLAVLAVNGDPAESDLRAFDPEELAAVARPAGDDAAARAAAAGLTAGERERRQALWWYLLMAALLLLAAETVVAHRARRAS